MPEPIDKLRYACEDESWEMYSKATTDLFLSSIAVSLKRIADHLTAPPTSPTEDRFITKRRLEEMRQRGVIPREEPDVVLSDDDRDPDCTSCKPAPDARSCPLCWIPF